MYNSIFLGILMRITRYFQGLYEMSFINKIITIIKRRFKIIYRNSNVNGFNRNVGKVFKDSIFYKLVGLVFKGVDFVLDALNDFNKKLTNGSEVSNSLSFYSNSIERGLRLFYETLLILGVLLLLGSFIGFVGISKLVLLILIIVSLFGLLINGYETLLINNSKVFNFFFDLFKLDEGGENWW